VVSRQGAIQVLEPEMSAEEKTGLDRSVDLLRRAIVQP
jgi:hypothetical protein